MALHSNCSNIGKKTQESTLSPDFLIQLMNSPAAKTLGVPFLIAGLALLTTGMLSTVLIPDCPPSASIGGVVTGSIISAFGARMALGYSMFFPSQGESTKETPKATFYLGERP
jgi:hypothetical protein